MSPLIDPDVPADETAAFVLSWLPPSPRLLDVGCGTGAVSARLRAAGVAVVAVDSDAAHVSTARARGIAARRCAWPAFHDAKPFDALVFSRTLHHLHPLAPALDAAAHHLVDGGILLVEDFAFMDAGRDTIQWFVDLLWSLEATGLVPRIGDPCFAQSLMLDGPGAWHTGAAHELHDAAAMEIALRARFAVESAEGAPYLYRYVTPLFGARPELVRSVFDLEVAAAKAGEIELIGRRWVARKVSSASSDASRSERPAASARSACAP